MNLVTFLDTVGRTIIGELIAEDEKILKVKNPVVVNITPQQDGTGNVKMALRLFPLFLRELLADKGDSSEWVYQKNLITMPVNQLVLDFRLTIQYQQLFAPIDQMPAQNVPAAQVAQPSQAVQANQSKPEIIKLFDD